jgi:hypothetical protein
MALVAVVSHARVPFSVSSSLDADPCADRAGEIDPSQVDDIVAASAPVTRHRAMVSWPSLSVSCCV